MKISGKITISKKYQSEDRDFQRNEKVGWGRLSWMNKVGEKKTYTNKAFAVFDPNIDTIANNLGKLFHIEGILRTEEYVNKEGETKKMEKVMINSVAVYETVQSEQKSVEQVKEVLDIEIDDSIPF